MKGSNQFAQKDEFFGYFSPKVENYCWMDTIRQEDS